VTSGGGLTRSGSACTRRPIAGGLDPDRADGQVVAARVVRGCGTAWVGLVLWWARATSRPVSTTGWLLYAPGEAWIEGLVGGPWTLEMVTEPAGSWHGAFFKHCQEQPWDVERRLRMVSGRTAIPMLACYVETSDFGYALALARGELVARYLVNAHFADDFVEGVWALEQCLALHGRDWQQAGLEELAGWSRVVPRPLTADLLKALLAGEHLFPEDPLFNELGLALGIEAPSAQAPQADVGVFGSGELPPEHHQGVVAAFESLGVAARVWADPTHPGLDDVHCLVLARLSLQEFLGWVVGSPVAEDAYPGIKRLVDRLFADQPEVARPSQVLVLEDSATREQVVLTADLPAVACRRLVPYLSSIRRGGTHHYDRQSGEWRSQPGA
jgi:hypothetical protein